MEEIGVVKETRGPNALVLVQRHSACEGCAAGSVCKSAGEFAEIEALNLAQARSGDRVKVSMKPYTYLKGTLLLFGLPSLFLIAGAILGKEYVSRFFAGFDPDIVSAATGFGLCALSFVTVRVLSRRHEARGQSLPVIEEVLRV